VMNPKNKRTSKPRRRNKIYNLKETWKRLGNNPFQFPISRICMQGYCVKGNSRDLSWWGGGGRKCQVFEGDLADETPISLATSIFVHKVKYIIWM
jgi:hypothetical protein